MATQERRRRRGQEQPRGSAAVVINRKRRSEVWNHFDCVRTDNGEEKARCKNCAAELAADPAKHGTTHLSRHVRSCCTDPDFVLPSRREIDEICHDAFSEEAEPKLLASCCLESTSSGVSVSIATATKIVEGETIFIAYQFIDEEWDFHHMIKDAFMLVPDSRHRVGPLSGMFQLCPGHVEEELILAGIIQDMDCGDFESRLFSIAWGVMGDDDLNMTLRDAFVNADILRIFYDHMDDFLHSIARSLLDNIIRDYFFDYVLSTVPTLTRHKSEVFLSQLGLESLCTYNEQWYSCYSSLEIIHELISEEGSALAREQEGIISMEDIRKIKGIDSEDRGFIEPLRKVWNTIYRAIRAISVHKVPTSNLCLRELFRVRKVLQDELTLASGDNNANINDYAFLVDNGFVGVFKEAIDELDAMIDVFYLPWSLPHVLDPRYKLKCIELHFNFNTAFGSEGAADIISKVTGDIKEMFDYYYSKYGENIIIGEDSNTVDEMAVDSIASSHHIVSNENLSEQQFNEEVPQKRESELAVVLEKSELDLYLEEDLVPESEDFNILSWWKGSTNKSKYPTLARMARDALAMPTCRKLPPEMMAIVTSRFGSSPSFLKFY